MIKALSNSMGVLTEDPVELKNMVTAFYTNLYTSEGVGDVQAVLDHVPVCLNQEMNLMLCAPYTN